MKVNVKKLACVAIAFSMIASVTACKKDKKKSSGAVEAAETFLDAAVSLDAKKLKKLPKSMEIDEDALSDLQDMADDEFISAVMAKASYEIDEDSIKEKKKSTTLKATVTFPDYEKAFEDADRDLDDFVDAIESQKEKKYQSVEVTLKFSVDDDQYTLTNADDFYNDIYVPMIATMSGNGVVVPTDPEPTITTTESEDPTTTTTEDILPTTTSPASNGTVSDLEFNEMKKVNFNQDSYRKAITNADPSALVMDMDIDESPDSYTAGYNLKQYVASISTVGDMMTGFYSFNSTEDCYRFFDDFTVDYMSGKTGYTLESDWGFLIRIYGKEYEVYYFSGSSMIFLTATLTEEASQMTTAIFSSIGAI